MIKNHYNNYKLKGEIFIQEHQVTFKKVVPKLLAISKIEQILEFM